jgi:hypothetical protein
LRPASSGAVARLVAFQRFCKLQQAFAGAFAEAVIGPNQFQRLFLRENIAFHILIGVIGGVRRISDRDAVEEVLHRHVQRPRQFVKARGRDAVGTAFVLLDLLESHANLAREVLLGHAQKAAAAAKALAYVQIGFISHYLLQT